MFFKVYFCNYTTGEVVIANRTYRSYNRCKYYFLQIMRNSGSLSSLDFYSIWISVLDDGSPDLLSPSVEEVGSLPVLVA